MLNIKALDDTTVIENSAAQGPFLHPPSLSSMCINKQGCQVGGVDLQWLEIMLWFIKPLYSIS